MTNARSVGHKVRSINLIIYTPLTFYRSFSDITPVVGKYIWILCDLPLILQQLV